MQTEAPQRHRNDKSTRDKKLSKKAETGENDKLDKRKAYNAFRDERKAAVRADLEEKQKELSRREKSHTIAKIIGKEWRRKTEKEKKEYGRKAIAVEQRRAREQERGENVYDMYEHDSTVARIAKCLICGRLFNGEQKLMQHMAGHRTPIGDVTNNCSAAEEALTAEEVVYDSSLEEEEDTGKKNIKGSLQNSFLEKIGHLAKQRAPPPPLPVSWAAIQRKKSIMFFLQFLAYYCFMKNFIFLGWEHELGGPPPPRSIKKN